MSEVFSNRHQEGSILAPSELDETHSLGDKDKALFQSNILYMDEFENVLFADEKQQIVEVLDLTKSFENLEKVRNPEKQETLLRETQKNTQKRIQEKREVMMLRQNMKQLTFSYQQQFETNSRYKTEISKLKSMQSTHYSLAILEMKKKLD